MRRASFTTLAIHAGIVILFGIPCFAQTAVTDPATLSIGRKGLTATTLNDGTVLAAGGASSTDNPYSSVDRILSTSSVGAAAAMYSVREYATSTLLKDGTVLVTGGYNGSTSVNDAETYDPSTHYFSATTNAMARQRYGHTATLLNDGTVLIVGGRDPGNSEIDTVEIYNPSTRSFSTLPAALHYARYFHTATLLPSGNVYLAGGADYNSSGIVQSELYNPSNQSVSLAGNLLNGRAYHTATLLPNGKVLLAGGQNSSGTYSSAEIYDPSTNASTSAGNLSTSRWAHTATSLADGRILFAGGYAGSGGPTTSAEVFDPTVGTFSVTGSMNYARAFHAAVGLPDASVLVIGGVGPSSALPSIESYSYSMNTGTFSPKFIVISIAYAPPGSGSNVDYSNTSTLGTNFTFTGSTTNGVTTSYTNGASIPYIGGLQITDSSGWSKTVGSTNSYGLTKTLTSADTVPGPSSDGLNHDADEYYVWIDPIFDISIPNNSSTFVWNNVAYDQRDNFGLDILNLSGVYLKNPGLLSASTATRLARQWDTGSNGGMTTADYQTVLNRNPFVVNPNYNPTVADPTTGVFRFQSLQNNPINYIPAAPGTQPVTHTQTVSYTATSGSGVNASDTYHSSFEIATMAGSFGPKSGASLTSTSTLTLTSTYNSQNQKGQSSSLTIVPPASTDSYAGTTGFGLYEDNVYGTFMFYPIQAGRPGSYSDVGLSATTNPSALQSGGGTATVNGTVSLVVLPQGHGVRYQAAPGKCIWSGFGTAVTAKPETLYVSYSTQNGGSSPGDYNASILLSVNGGSTWTTLANPSGSGQISYTVPTGTNLSQVQVQATVNASYSGTATGSHYAKMPISLMLVQ